MARRARQGLGRTLVLVALSVAVAAGLLLVAPTSLGGQFRTLVHVREPDRVLPAVAVPRTHGHFAFAKTQPGTDDPVTYSPCHPIPYVVNLSGGPADGDTIITTAITRISAAAGLAFEDRGTTEDTHFTGRHAGDPVLIGFVRSGVLDGLSRESGNVGLGGSTAVPSGIAHFAYRTGMVALRTDWFDDPQVGEPQKIAVVMHELGHVLGLGHVDDTRELMAGTNVGLTHLGPGDREGLARLGRGAC
ncbi:MAG: matrixin family metalloprotease [Nocardioides sp.]